MKLGDIDITNPMLGTTPINEVRRGDVLIWQRAERDMNWYVVGFTKSKDVAWAFDRFRLYYPDELTKVGMYSIFDALNGMDLLENGRLVINADPTFGSQVFASDNSFEHDFAFDLSASDPELEVYIAIQGIPSQAQFQQIYTYPTGYSATRNKDAKISGWDFSAVNPAANVGGVHTSIFMNNQVFGFNAGNIMWTDTTREPKIFAKTLRFENSQLAAVDVDKIIQWTDAGGTLNGTLDYSGNENPTSASRAAYDSLIAKAWTITGAVPAASTYQVSILSPTEGQEVTADFSVLATDNKNTVETNLTEGQEVQSDFTVTFS